MRLDGHFLKNSVGTPAFSQDRGTKFTLPHETTTNQKREHLLENKGTQRHFTKKVTKWPIYTYKHMHTHTHTHTRENAQHSESSGTAS